MQLQHTSSLLLKQCRSSSISQNLRGLHKKICTFQPERLSSCLAFTSITAQPSEHGCRRIHTNTQSWTNHPHQSIINHLPPLHSNHLSYDSRRKHFSTSTTKKVTSLTLASMKRHSKKISMVTAYDYPSALHVDRAGIDVILVGDSCAMVELGYSTTQPITMDEMIHHCKAVKRGVGVAGNQNDTQQTATTPMLVGDMPFGSYEISPTHALQNAYRFLKEAGMDCVKLEGGSSQRCETTRQLVQGGIAVMGHVGLTPQAISVLGGFRAQGRSAIRARKILDEALRLQDAGACSVVLECVPSNVARVITDALEIPTIGIGAGPHTDGQVLVYHDMLGMTSHPHHEHFVPKFCKRYARVGDAVAEGLEQFKQDVKGGSFPGEEFSPYKMTEAEEIAFDNLLAQDAMNREKSKDVAARRLKEEDEYESLNLYGGSSNGNDNDNGNGSANGDNSTK